MDLNEKVDYCDVFYLGDFGNLVVFGIFLEIFCYDGFKDFGGVDDVGLVNV